MFPLNSGSVSEPELSRLQNTSSLLAYRFLIQLSIESPSWSIFIASFFFSVMRRKVEVFLAKLLTWLSDPCLRMLSRRSGTASGRREGGREGGGAGAHQSLFSVVVPALLPTALTSSVSSAPSRPHGPADGLELSFRQKGCLRVLHYCFRYV